MDIYAVYIDNGQSWEEHMIHMVALYDNLDAALAHMDAHKKMLVEGFKPTPIVDFMLSENAKYVDYESYVSNEQHTWDMYTSQETALLKSHKLLSSYEQAIV